MKTLTLLLLISLTLTTSTQAAERERERERGRERGRPEGRPEGRGGPGALLENLNEEGRAAMREIFMEMREVGGDLQRKSQSLREQLMKLVLSGDADEKAIRAKVRELSDVEADATVLRAKAVAKMKAAGIPEEAIRAIAMRMGGRPPEAQSRGMEGRGGFGERGRGRDFGRGEREEGRKPSAEGRREGRPEFDF